MNDIFNHSFPHTFCDNTHSILENLFPISMETLFWMLAITECPIKKQKKTKIEMITFVIKIRFISTK